MSIVVFVTHVEFEDYRRRKKERKKFTGASNRI
jgi:hypothetical protein